MTDISINIYDAREMLREMESDKATVRVMAPKAEAYDTIRTILKLTGNDGGGNVMSHHFGYGRLSMLVRDFDHINRDAEPGEYQKAEPIAEKPRRGRPPKVTAKPKRKYTRRNPPPKIKLAKRGRPAKVKR